MREIKKLEILKKIKTLKSLQKLKSLRKLKKLKSLKILKTLKRKRNFMQECLIIKNFQIRKYINEIKLLKKL